MSLSVEHPAPLPPLTPPRRPATPQTARSSTRHRSLIPEPPSADVRPITPSLRRTPGSATRTAVASNRDTVASPAHANDNFILPTDVDEDGHLLATITTFPRHALKVMEDWKEHLPLHILTPDNIAEYSRRPTVPKPNSDKSRIIQDLSFPRDDPTLTSVNSEINSDDFPCEWGSFAQCYFLVAKAP